MNSAKERAAEGAWWLDQLYPGWHNHINLLKLDINNSYLCVGAQLDQHLYPYMAGTSWTRPLHNIPRHVVNAAFVGKSTDRTWYGGDRLNRAWRKEIKRRRKDDRNRPIDDRNLQITATRHESMESEQRELVSAGR